MATRRPPDSESTERNAPSVEAAFQAAPEEMVAEILDGELYLVWHLDPLARSLEIYRLQENQWRLVHSFTGEGRVRAEPFEAIELELALVWSR